MKTTKNLQPKTITRRGVTHSRSTKDSINADVTPTESIRIYGTMIDRVREPESFNRVFKIGDEVIHGSYNLIYTGKIIAIGAKTVTVKDHDRKKRMTLYEFADRNWDLDLDRVHKRNHFEMQCI